MRVLLIAAIALVGCYSPKFQNGGFLCGANGLCPHGMSCNPDDNHCYFGTVGGTQDMSTSGGDLGSSDMALSSTDMAAGPFFGNGTLGDLDLTGISGQVTCNTETGEILAPGNVAVVHAGQTGFSNTAQSSGPPVAIWNFRNVKIPAGVTLRPSSSSVSVLVFAATETITLAGTIDWSGYGGIGGAPGNPGGTRQSGVASGGGGAAGTTDGSAGGGAGYASMGTKGGGVASTNVGGAPYGTADLHIVHFGSGGGGGGNGSAGSGGNGGGAVALFGRMITISGKIDVSAFNGAPAGSGVAGGGGGGSGGSILISGGNVLLDTGHSLVATGGTGGMAGSGGGFVGGAGSVGRVYVTTPMFAVTGGGQPSSMPQAIVGTAAVASFPN